MRCCYNHLRFEMFLSTSAKRKVNEKHLKDRKVFVQIKGDSADASNRMKKQNIKPPRGNASTFRGKLN